MTRVVWVCEVVVLLLGMALGAGEKTGVHMADGIKIGEVRQDSAIVWTRLTRNAERNVDGLAFTEERTVVPTGRTLNDMEGSVPGMDGEVRVAYWTQGAKDKRKETAWAAVDSEADFTRQIALSGLTAGTTYEIEVQGRRAGASEPSARLAGGFRTPPNPGEAAKVMFVAVTCQEYPKRDRSAERTQDLLLDARHGAGLLRHTGDIEYYDRPFPFAKTVELARFKWNRIYAMPFQREFHKHVSSYFMKDDHDTLKDDCCPGRRMVS